MPMFLLMLTINCHLNRFDLKWLENSDFRDIRRVNKSTDLSEEEKICLRGLHKRLTGLPENPSGTDLKMLREAYGKYFISTSNCQEFVTCLYHLSIYDFFVVGLPFQQ